MTGNQLSMAGILGFLAVSLPAPCPGTDWDYKQPLVQRTHHEDLDGDGRPEYVVVDFFRVDGFGYDRAVLEIGPSRVIVRGSSMMPELHFVDIDSTDAFREIAIFQIGPSDDYATHFFRYSCGEIVNLGTIPGKAVGLPQVRGDGVISTKCRGKVLETWFYPCQFEIDGLSARLRERHQRLKPMAARVTLRTALPLYSASWGTEPAGTLHAGEHAVVTKTDDQSWCYIEGESGVCGWFALIGGCRIAVNGLPATEVFEGLIMAD